MPNAALAGVGLAYVPDGMVQPQSSAAFALLVDALRLPGRLGLLMQLAAPHQPTGDIGRLERRAFGR